MILVVPSKKQMPSHIPVWGQLINAKELYISGLKEIYGKQSICYGLAIIYSPLYTF